MIYEFAVTVDTLDQIATELRHIMKELFDPDEDLTVAVITQAPPHTPTIFNLNYGPVPQLPVIMVGEDRTSDTWWPYRKVEEEIANYPSQADAIEAIKRYFDKNEASLIARLSAKMAEGKKVDPAKIDQVPTVAYRIELTEDNSPVLAVCLTYRNSQS